MKSLIKLSLIAVLATFSSCTFDDVEDRPVIEATDAPMFLAPSSGSYELDFNQPDAQVERFVWSEANFGGDVAITYELEMDAEGGDFSAAQVLGSVIGQNQVAVNTTTFNNAAMALGATPFSATTFDVRIKAYVSEAMASLYSDIITITIIPYTTEAPKLAVPGNHQGWDPTTAPLLAASDFGETDYEGYVWLDGEYKFVAPDDAGNFAWGNTDWGDDGTFTGVLLEENESNCNASNAGYYLIQADTDALTYSFTEYDWGLIGDATPNGWDADQNMTYDSATATWTITLDLVAGEIKFRANDGWDWNYGDTGADGSLENGGDNIVITADGNYTVTLDLSTPRAYTYSVTQN